MYMRLGISGSALPATIQRDVWNLYLQSSAATMSIRTTYLALLSMPAHLALSGGNMRLSEEPREDKATAEKSDDPANIVPRRAPSPTLVRGSEKLRMVSKKVRPDASQPASKLMLFLNTFGLELDTHTQQILEIWIMVDAY
ncbi:hypothetical protein EYF80_020659 [Liparis tanakae]|uniref:Uncharacterized protein n=1 Tax=Liparis tanakae TaxID=230148 RepID=A0A4Z2HT96_9TELE|nr:hypothetical protein EYF80_020659 [Liparis tanakae]